MLRVGADLPIGSRIAHLLSSCPCEAELPSGPHMQVGMRWVRRIHVGRSKLNGQIVHLNRYRISGLASRPADAGHSALHGSLVHMLLPVHRQSVVRALLAILRSIANDHRGMTSIKELRSLLLTTEQLLDRGMVSQGMSRAVEEGGLVRLRPGYYVDASARELSRKDRHLLCVLATDEALDSPVFSHSSAALIHGLPDWDLPLGRVDVCTAAEVSRTRTTHRVRFRSRELDQDEVLIVDGLKVTSPTRTVADLALTTRRDTAVSVADAALARNLTSVPELQQTLEDMAGKSGIKRARRSLQLVDSRSESVAETRSRLIFADYGIPEPELQVRIDDHDGNRVARVDFLWREYGVIGECDGFGKYFDGVDMTETRRRLAAEKDRDAALIGLGYRVFHWRWADLDNPQLLAERILRVLFPVAV